MPRKKSELKSVLDTAASRRDFLIGLWLGFFVILIEVSKQLIIFSLEKLLLLPKENAQVIGTTLVFFGYIIMLLVITIRISIVDKRNQKVQKQ